MIDREKLNLQNSIQRNRTQGKGILARRYFIWGKAVRFKITFPDTELI